MAIMVRNRLLQSLMLVLALLTPLVVAGCASDDRVDGLEQRIRVIESQLAQMTIQQQNAQAEFTQRLGEIGGSITAMDQKLSSLEATASELSQADDDLERRLSEAEGRIYAGTLHQLVTAPWVFLTATGVVVILLFGILIGVWYCRWK